MRMLSIDWDYFFADLAWMDWGHNESALMLELIWTTRVDSLNLKTRESALDYVLPNLKLLYGGDGDKGFLERVLAKECERNLRLFVAESHVELLRWLDSYKLRQSEEIWISNYDQHHDCGYSDMPSGSYDCGAWAKGAYDIGKLNQYYLHYPAWRKDQPERSDRELKKRMKGFGVWDFAIKDPKRFDAVFICRSGGWTPPWCDADFIRFVSTVKRWCRRFEILGDRDPMIPRRPNMQEALLLREQATKQMNKMKQSLKQGQLPRSISTSRKN